MGSEVLQQARPKHGNIVLGARGPNGNGTKTKHYLPEIALPSLKSQRVVDHVAKHSSLSA